ncbi:HAD family hydrolase [Salinisphaera sp. Q1T1-3]|uniref:HAD family hydrolase n=1 Tax=Salinisphaera sp. Q1T1-3 TaxID=2321229 RepID=UPI001314C085|nr:HAD-IA family hydrolase [Salinisphaera sp. Q1T1-3]
MTGDYELIIFDWDGTLADSAGDFVGALQQAIQDTGLPERSPAQLRELIGLGITDIMNRLWPELDSGRVRQRLAGYRARYGWPRGQARLFDSVPATLARLDAAGYVLAVATGKSRRGLDRAMAQTECRAWFRITRCADESAPKPAPNLIDDILLRTATEPHRALMVGDTEYDMVMARQAGVDRVAVGSGVHDAARLERAGAMGVIAGVGALPAWLGLASSPGDDDTS